MCAECIEKYLTTEGKQKLECLLTAVRNVVDIEDIEPQESEDRGMTKQEAKEFIVQSIKDDVDVAEIADAIMTLDQEPCEEAISRQAVLDIVNNPLNIRLDEIIKKLPPVTPQPKTGHREYNDIYDHYLCGNCKTVVMDYDNFCPNCGAKMEDKE